jgi:hypothetical protein
VLSSAKFLAGRLNTTLASRWSPPPTQIASSSGSWLIDWAARTGRPVNGYRGIFTGLSPSDTVEQAERLVSQGEELAAVLDILMTDPLPADSLAYRLRHAPLSGISV